MDAETIKRNSELLLDDVETANYIMERFVNYEGEWRWLPVATFEVDTGAVVRPTFTHRADAEKALDKYKSDRPDNQYRIVAVN